MLYCGSLILGKSADGDIMPPMVGGQYDNNGCIIGGGYSWCDASQSCIRQWVTPCADHYQDCGDCLKRQRNGENIACPVDCDTTDDTDCFSDSDCDNTHFCRPYTMNVGGSKDCVSFSVEGESCGGYTLPSQQSRCSPDLECANTMGPMIADAPGQCMRPCKMGSIRDNYGNCLSGVMVDPLLPTPPTPVPIETPCPDVMCMMYCENGFEQDGDGCDICLCSDPVRPVDPVGPIDPVDPIGLIDECDIPYVDCGDTYTFLCPKVSEITTCSEGGLPGYTTYQLSIKFKENKNIKNLFAIYGSSTNGQGGQMIIPPAKNIDNIFGSNIGGVSNEIILMNPESEYDSWITIGETDGNIDNEVSTIGIPFERWSETSGLTVTDGAIFLMNPDVTMDIYSELIVGRITIATGTSETAVLNFQGKYTDENVAKNHLTDSRWVEEQVSFILNQPLSHNGNGIPINCRVWYDGCNTCQINNGNMGACSRMMCFREDTPYCMNYNTGH